jgi:hypothetical protein
VNEVPLVTEALIARGHAVTYVTPLEALASHAGWSHRKDFATIFRRTGTRVLSDLDVSKYDGFSAALVDPDGHVAHELETDTIVAVTAPVPQLAVVAVLDELAISHSVIGDASAPRGVQVAMREADDISRFI